MSFPSRIILADLNPALIAAWQQCFAGVDRIEIRPGDFFAEPADAVVSPANSFGIMDGGLDLLIRETLPGVETAVQRMIVEMHHGEIPVGCAEVVASNHLTWPYLICAPTMRVPENISRSMNPYLAMRAALLAAVRFNERSSGHKIESLLIPGLGTGVGRMSPERCAAQMRHAYHTVIKPAQIPGFHAIHSTHVKLMSA